MEIFTGAETAGANPTAAAINPKIRSFRVGASRYWK
jgi:hypothetical protein